MINEKMIELLVLIQLLNNFLIYDRQSQTLKYNGSIYDTNKIEERLNDLVVEFLRQYKIDSTSKES